MVECSFCIKKLNKGEIIRIQKSANVYGTDDVDYEPDGNNFEIVCEECI